MKCMDALYPCTNRSDIFYCQRVKFSPSGYRVPTSFQIPALRNVPADFADLIIPTIEMTAEKVKISLLVCADHADDRLLSDADLRNLQIP